jgi:hypothetical protein
MNYEECRVDWFDMMVDVDMFLASRFAFECKSIDIPTETSISHSQTSKENLERLLDISDIQSRYNLYIGLKSDNPE